MTVTLTYRIQGPESPSRASLLFIKKSKTIPVHAMVAYRGCTDTAKLHAPGSSPLGKNPGTQRTEDRGVLKQGLDVFGEEKIACPCRGSNPV